MLAGANRSGMATCSPLSFLASLPQCTALSERNRAVHRGAAGRAPFLSSGPWPHARLPADKARRTATLAAMDTFTTPGSGTMLLHLGRRSHLLVLDRLALAGHLQLRRGHLHLEFRRRAVEGPLQLVAAVQLVRALDRLPEQGELRLAVP